MGQAQSGIRNWPKVLMFQGLQSDLPQSPELDFHGLSRRFGRVRVWGPPDRGDRGNWGATLGLWTESTPAPPYRDWAARSPDAGHVAPGIGPSSKQGGSGPPGPRSWTLADTGHCCVARWMLGPCHPLPLHSPPGTGAPFLLWLLPELDPWTPTTCAVTPVKGGQWPGSHRVRLPAGHQPQEPQHLPSVPPSSLLPLSPQAGRKTKPACVMWP